MKISFLQDGLYSPAKTSPHKFLVSPRNPANPRLIASPTNFNPGVTLRPHNHPHAGSLFQTRRAPMREELGRKSSLQHDLLPSIGFHQTPTFEKESLPKTKALRALKAKLPLTIIGPRKNSDGALLSDIAKIYGRSKTGKPFFGKRNEENQLVINNFHTVRPIDQVLRSPISEQAKTSLKATMVQNIFQQTFTPILPKKSPNDLVPAVVRTPSALKSPRKEEPSPIQSIQAKPTPGEANVPIIRKSQRKKVVSDLIVRVSPRKATKIKLPERVGVVKNSPKLKEVSEAEESANCPPNLLEGVDLSNYRFTNPYEKEEGAIIGFSVKSRTVKNKNGRQIFISTLNGLSRPDLTEGEKDQIHSATTARSLHAKSIFSPTKKEGIAGSIGTASTLESTTKPRRSLYNNTLKHLSVPEDGPWTNEESENDQEDSVLQGILGFIKDKTEDLEECSFIEKRTEEIFDDSLVILN